jgi:hypothetical protein
VLDTDIPSSALGALDTFYQTALSSVVADIAAEDIQSDARTILGAIMVCSRLDSTGELTTPILITLLARLNVTHAEGFLNKLRSIMITDNEEHGIQLMHKSLDDFLTDERRCGDGWYICLQDQYSNVTSACLSELLALFEDHTYATWDSPWSPIASFAINAMHWIAIDDHIKNIHSQPMLYKNLQEFFSIYLLHLAGWLSSENADITIGALWNIGYTLQDGIFDPSLVSMPATHQLSVHTLLPLHIIIAIPAAFG